MNVSLERVFFFFLPPPGPPLFFLLNSLFTQPADFISGVDGAAIDLPMV